MTIHSRIAGAILVFVLVLVASNGYALVNTAPIPQAVAARYAAQGAAPVALDFASPAGHPLVVRADVVGLGPVVRHAADKLAPILCERGRGHLWP